MSKNAEGWIRHRGGKCPVEEGVMVDVRHRDGEVFSGFEAVLSAPAGSWNHANHPGDIMAYRLHKPAEQVEACSKPDPRDSARRDSDYVCWMRDRITEIDATTQALTTERADLVQKLAGEGFVLIGRVVEIVSDVEIEEWQRLALDGRKVMAIKEYRNLTGSSLRNALDVIDAFIADNA